MGEILTLKALSRLLTYPTPELVEIVSPLAEVLAEEALVDPQVRADLAPLLAALADADIYDLQEAYVGLFDRTRRLSLHLFEHVHGESRDRGQAMVDLAALYEKGGLAITANELPDFLPLFLEYAATRPREEALALLADVDHILATLEERLAERGSDYAAVFTALRSLHGAAEVTPRSRATGEAAADPLADDLATLDKEWEESVVTFGPGEAMGGCSVDRFRMQLRAAQRDARHSAA